MTIKKGNKNRTNQTLIRLEKVSKSDLRFLYNLLRQRDPQAKISHKKMPTYSEHVKFVMSKPYSYWYTIRKKNSKIGSIYLSKQNEIGIFLDKKFFNKGVGTEALKLLIKKHPRERYIANINPNNKKSIKFFKKHGFKLIQHSFELMSNE